MGTTAPGAAAAVAATKRTRTRRTTNCEGDLWRRWVNTCIFLQATLKASGRFAISVCSKVEKGFVVAISQLPRCSGCSYVCILLACFAVARRALDADLEMQVHFPCLGGGVLDPGSRLSPPPGLQVYPRRTPRQWPDAGYSAFELTRAKSLSGRCHTHTSESCTRDSDDE